MIADKTERPVSASSHRNLLGPLWLQVMVGILLGIAVGVLFPHTAVALKPLGDGFVKLIRMTLAPIIFATVVVGIAKMGDLREVGRVGAKALIYFEVVSTFALLLGLVAANVLQPGKGMNIDAATLDSSAISSYTASAKNLGVVPFLLNIVPSSVGEAFVSGNVLQIILFGVLFGLALAQLRTSTRPLVDMLDQFPQGNVRHRKVRYVSRAPGRARGHGLYRRTVWCSQPPSTRKIHRRGLDRFNSLRRDCAGHHRPRCRIQPLQTSPLSQR